MGDLEEVGWEGGKKVGEGVGGGGEGGKWSEGGGGEKVWKEEGERKREEEDGRIEEE